MPDPTTSPVPSSSEIKALAKAHRVDPRTLRRFFLGTEPRGVLVREACAKARKAWRAKAARARKAAQA